MPDATALQGLELIRVVTPAAAAVGEIYQLPDGRAGVLSGLNAVAEGDYAGFADRGQYTVTKTSGLVVLDGAPLYWDHSANACTPLTPTSDRDFYLGAAVGDATSDETTCVVNLNVRPGYQIDLASGVWTVEATNGLGVTLLPGNGVQLAFDAVTEAAQVAIYSQRTFPVASNWIVEGRVAIFDKGDNAALDCDFGVASGSHATDFQSVAEFATIHWDGNDLSLLTQSDDGTTDVAPDDTGVDAVDDTYFDFWIDGRDHEDVAFYVNGVRVNSNVTHTLEDATGPLKAIVHMEKTSDDTPADFRVDFLRVRLNEGGAS